jgi:hypothetical protein
MMMTATMEVMTTRIMMMLMMMAMTLQKEKNNNKLPSKTAHSSIAQPPFSRRDCEIGKDGSRVNHKRKK